MAKYELLSKVESMLPSNAQIVESVFEGANMVLYSKNKSFVLNSSSLIRRIVNTVKKRVEVRPDPSILISPDSAKAIIEKEVPEEAGLQDVWFDDQRSIVILEADKPGLVIGHLGRVTKSIRSKTLWIPFVRRAPAIKSDLVKTIRYTIFSNSGYRRKFMHRIGQKIYGTPINKNNYWIRLSCLGGFREVGRSCSLLQTPHSRVLIDCGVNVASENRAYPHFEAPEFDVKALDAIIVSHAHLDHSALVPLLFKYGFKGPVYCSEPTRDIMTLLQLDYIDVNQREGKKLLFDSRDIKNMIKHTFCLSFDEVTDITNDVRLTLFNSGHVLGASMAHFNIGDGFHNMIYTGDFKFADTNMLSKASNVFQRLETLVMESTYGAKTDIPLSLKECEKTLISLINETISNGGKVLVPVLGAGRAQEIILIIEKAVRDKALKDVKVHVDGMVWDVSAIHTTYPEFMNRDVKNLVFRKDHNPFLAPCFKWVGSQKERVELINSKKPCVILATSGMLTGGSSVEYFRQLAENPVNRLIIVSYQGRGSLGRRLQAGERTIKMELHKGGVEVIKVRMGIETIEGFSGHSNRQELIDFVKYLQPRPKRVIVMHGESSKCLDLASSIHKLFRVETQAPRNLDTIRIR